MRSTRQLIQALEEKIPRSQATNTNVSSASVGWHIAHSMLAVITTINKLTHSDPTLYRWSLSIPRLFVLSTGIIPTGVAESPADVIPAGTSNQQLASLVTEAVQALELAASLPKNSYVHHPVFGDIRLQQALRVMQVHTNHHLKIVSKILEKA